MTAAEPSTQAHVLVVDDDHQIRNLLTRFVEAAGHRCDGASTAAEARAALETGTHDLVLLDMYLPDDSGLGVARDLATRPSAPAVVMVSGEDDPGLVRIALDGGAYGYVTKPFKRADVDIAIDNALRRRAAERQSRRRSAALEDCVVDRAAAVHDALERMRLAQEDTVERLSQAVALRDPRDGVRIERMSRICALIGGRVGLDADVLRVASRLHDIGNVAISDAILRKPGPLTADERADIERHAEIGYRLLRGSRSAVLDAAAEIAWTHHERFDGSGYPRGIAGAEIPLAGRVAAVADVFDALTSDRAHRPARNVGEVVAHIDAERGRHFDPAVVEAFLEMQAEIGAVIAELDDGAPKTDIVLATATAEARLLTLQEVASTVGVSPSTMRRWADDGRLRAVRTSGGHRRFPLEAVREFAASRRPQAVVRPIDPPEGALPEVGALIRRAGSGLVAKAAASLYRGGRAGWFSAPVGGAALDQWLAALASACDRGAPDSAMQATDGLMTQADLHGASLLERHVFLERFGEATVRALAHDGASRPQLIAARRLFVALQQGLLATC